MRTAALQTAGLFTGGHAVTRLEGSHERAYPGALWELALLNGTRNTAVRLNFTMLKHQDWQMIAPVLKIWTFPSTCRVFCLWATSNLQRGPGVGRGGHVWSCCGQTCCLTLPARDRPRSLWWKPPPAHTNSSRSLTAAWDWTAAFIICSRWVSYLEPPHVSWVPCIFQTVLIALEEELEEESAD